MKNNLRKVLIYSIVLLSVAAAIIVTKALRVVPTDSEQNVTSTQNENTEAQNDDLLTQSVPSILNSSDWSDNYAEDFKIKYQSPSTFTWETQKMKQGTIDGVEYGDHGFAVFSIPGEDRLKPSIISVAPINNPLARGGYWGDIVNTVEDEVSCDILTANVSADSLVSCDTFQNSNGIEVVHIVERYTGFYAETALINMYVVAHPDPKIRTVMFADDSILPRDELSDAVAKYLASSGFNTVQDTRNLVRTMVDTLEFVQ